MIEDRLASLELRGVFKTLGRQRVVDDVHLSVWPGEFFSLLGPSGCGKSTTLRIMAGFETADAGEVRVQGQLANGRPAYVDRINMVFQHYALFPHLTVWENVAFGLRMQRVPPAEVTRRVSEMLELVRLQGLDQRLPRQLSGGQQQRVALARALVPRPQVVLLDEPLGALDLKLRKAMQWELKALQVRLGLTFVYVTHDQEEALTMSDRMAVMNHGRVLQVGEPEDIYERPRTRFVASFIGESNFLGGHLRRDGEAWRIEETGGAVRVGRPETGTWTEGERVEAALRPERIWIGDRRPEHLANAFRGTVVASVYFGTDTMFQVLRENGEVVQVRQQNLDRRGLPVGGPGWVGWAPEAVRLLEPEPEMPTA